MELEYTTNLQRILFCKQKIANDEVVLLPEILKFISTDSLTNEEVRELSQMYDMTTGQLNQYIKKHKARAKVEDELGVVPTTEYEFIDALFKKWNLTVTFDETFTEVTPYRYDGNVISLETFKELSHDDQQCLIKADPKTYNITVLHDKVLVANAVFGLKYTERQLIHAVKVWKDREKNKINAEICSDVAFDKRVVKDAEVHWDILTHSITDTNINETKVILKHFVWQVKRKMTNRDVDYHCMPVLTGLQGTGKSELIKRFVKPLIDFTTFTDFQQVADKSNHGIWSKYILVFDEMSKAGQTDMDMIKNAITSTKTGSRVHYSHDNAEFKNNATFIGSANRSLSRIFFDDTGMRRFFEIVCLRKFDWAITNSIPYETLWKSINEQEDSPLFEDDALLDKIKNIQEQSRRIGTVEQFLLDREYTKGVEKVNATDFFSEFQKFEEEQCPRKEYTQTRFGNEVIDLMRRMTWLSITKTRRSNNSIYLIEKVGEKPAGV